MRLLRNKALQAAPLGALRPFLYILFLVLLMGTALLLFTFFTVRTQITGLSRGILDGEIREARNTLENQMDFVRTTLFSISSDQDVVYIAGHSQMSRQEQQNKVTRIVGLLQKAKLSNDLIRDIYIHFPRAGIVVADGLYPQNSYETLPAGMVDRIRLYGTNIFQLDGGASGRLAVVSELASGKDNGYVVMTLDSGRIDSMLGGSSLYPGELVFLLDENGELLFTNKTWRDQDEQRQWEQVLAGALMQEQSSVPLGGTAYTVIAESSAKTAWRYALLVPTSEFTALERAFMKTALICFFIVLVMSAALGGFTARMILRPLRALRRRIAGRVRLPSPIDTVGDLDAVIGRILDENTRLQDLADRSIPQLREKLLLQLMMRPAGGGDTDKDRLDMAGLNFPGKSFLVIVAGFAVYMDQLGTAQSLQGEVCKQYLMDNLHGDGVMHVVQFEPSRYFALLNGDSLSVRSLHGQLDRLARDFKDCYKVSLFAGISAVTCDFARLHHAFLEACSAYERQVVLGQRPVGSFEEEDSPCRDPLFYPFQVDETLQMAIRSSDTLGVERAMVSLKDFMMKNLPPTEWAMRQIFLVMFNNIRQTLREIDDLSVDREALSDKALAEINKPNDLDRFLYLIHDFSMKVLSCYRQQNSRKKTEIVLRAQRFIDENYQSLLTVNEIAAAVYISAPYLFRLMREEIGVSPVHYLNQVRIQHAMDRLRNTDDLVSQIASDCGFETEQSFYRQFKQQLKCTPSQYRKRHQNK